MLRLQIGKQLSGNQWLNSAPHLQHTLTPLLWGLGFGVLAYADCTTDVGLCYFFFAFFQRLLAGVSLSASHANVNQTLSTTLPTVPLPAIKA